jgi:hypothetical protein
MAPGFGEAPQICGDLASQQRQREQRSTDMSGVSEAGLSWLFNTASFVNTKMHWLVLAVKVTKVIPRHAVGRYHI